MSWVVSYTPRSIVLFAENNLGYKLSDLEVRQRGSSVLVEREWQAQALKASLSNNDHIVFLQENKDV